MKTVIRDRVKELRRVKASALLPHPRNWRRHPPAQINALRGVLSEIGFADALLAYETPRGLTLVDGHLRAGLDPNMTVPVLVLDLDEAEADKLLLTLDPLAAMAQPDQDALLGLLASVDFQSQAVRDMLEALANGETQPMPPLYQGEAPEPQIDKADGLREKWGVVPGQIWQIGKHRLMCGDALKVETHQHLLNGTSIDLVLTDPPYGIGIEYGQLAEDTEEWVRRAIPQFMPLLREWPVILLTSGLRCLWEYPRPDWILAWIHPAGMGLGPWGFTSFHPILAYGKDPYLQNGLGSRPDSIVLATDRQGELGHPVIKPLAVWQWLLERGSCKQKDKVLDIFLGSGTTMVAAERLNRICYGIEIEPKYVAVALQRMADMGLKPELIES